MNKECWMTNRERRRKPKFPITECPKCDDMGTKDYTKCSICGSRNKKRVRRNKK